LNFSAMSLSLVSQSRFSASVSLNPNQRPEFAPVPAFNPAFDHPPIHSLANPLAACIRVGKIGNVRL